MRSIHLVRTDGVGSDWRPSRRWWRLLAAAGLMVITACGLPTTGQIQEIDPTRVPYGLVSPAPKSSVGAGEEEVSSRTRARVYWLDGRQNVVPVSVRLTTSGASARLTELLELLAAGPTNQQRTLGFGTALGPGVIITVTAITNQVADVEVQAAVAAPSANRLPVAVGQMVLTATSVPGIDAVRFVTDGNPLDVPLVGGELTSGPLGREDYLDLLVVPTIG
jgi:spore germination protein GerM